MRVRKGMTQAQLATELRRPQSYVAKVEVCERRLDVYEYVEWTRVLELEPAEAITRLATAMSGPTGSRRRVRRT